MTEARVVVDTNVVSYLFREGTIGNDYRYLIAGRRKGVSLLTFEELHFGAALQHWSHATCERLRAFLTEFVAIQVPAEAAEVCAALRARRRRIGRPIELADAWVAATALWYDIPLVTHDRDFERIPGLKVITLHGGWQVREPLPGLDDDGSYIIDSAEPFFERAAP